MAALIGISVFGFTRLGSEFMPPLYEGTIFYMPTTFPGLSVTAASTLLQEMDRRLKAFPEVSRVFGKSGRRLDQAVRRQNVEARIAHRHAHHQRVIV